MPSTNVKAGATRASAETAAQNAADAAQMGQAQTVKDEAAAAKFAEAKMAKDLASKVGKTRVGDVVTG